MSKLRGSIGNLLASTETNLNYTDILIQADEAVRVFSPRGWQDMAIEVEYDEIIALALELTRAKDKEGLFTLLANKGASNIGCHIYNTRVRVDISLMTSTHHKTQKLHENTIVIQEPKIEMVIRRHRDIIPLKDLMLPAQFMHHLKQRSGLILLTGQTASGKTSTCASALDYMNETWPAHIITIQDPIEHSHKNNLAVFSDKEVGRDTPSFSVATRDALRQRPDVIFISELRDQESCKKALYAAQSALVITTTHAPNLEEGIERILNFFPNEELATYRALKSALRCIISQSLIPHKSENRFVMFHEYVNGGNPIVQDCLAAGKGLESIRTALTMAVEIDIKGSTSADEATKRKHANLVGMNAALARAVVNGDIDVEDAKRGASDPITFGTVHSSLLGIKSNEEAQRKMRG